MDPAPLFTDIQGVPDGGQACWRKCPDGTRVRMAFWQGSSSKTVLIFPGRTEYIEKYGPVAREFITRGYSVAIADWRGQGLSDRHPNRPQMGHVGHFDEYQQDVAEMIGAVSDAGLPAPTLLLGHSMGGAIGLRALMTGLAVEKAIFSGPMWGIYVEPKLRLVAKIVALLGPKLGFGERFIPSAGRQNYVEKQPFEGNLLTNDAEIYKWLQDHLARHPELGLGGPSCHWYGRAVLECADLCASPIPPQDCLCFIGTREKIVSRDAVQGIIGRWSNGNLIQVEGGHHEVFMEPPATLKTVWADIDTFLAA